MFNVNIPENESHQLQTVSSPYVPVYPRPLCSCHDPAIIPLCTNYITSSPNLIRPDSWLPLLKLIGAPLLSNSIWSESVFRNPCLAVYMLCFHGDSSMEFHSDVLFGVTAVTASMEVAPWYFQRNETLPQKMISYVTMALSYIFPSFPSKLSWWCFLTILSISALVSGCVEYMVGGLNSTGKTIVEFERQTSVVYMAAKVRSEATIRDSLDEQPGIYGCLKYTYWC